MAYKCKCTFCAEHGDGEEGLPIWMQTFADMMTLLFAFFVLLYSMSTPDPVKYAAFSNAQATKTGGETDEKGEFREPIKNQAVIKKELLEMIEELDIEDKGNVTQDPRGVALELDGEICFDPGSVVVKQSLQNILQSAKEKFMTNPDDLRGILIEGHSDNEAIPPKLAEKYPTNWELSSARAAVVVNYLINDGVNSGRLSASGYADRWPAGATWNEVRSGVVDDAYIAQKNADETQRSKNRRIKIIFAIR